MRSDYISEEEIRDYWNEFGGIARLIKEKELDEARIMLQGRQIQTYRQRMERYGGKDYKKINAEIVRRIDELDELSYIMNELAVSLPEHPTDVDFEPLKEVMNEIYRLAFIGEGEYFHE